MCIIKSNTVCNSNEFYHDDEMKKNNAGIMVLDQKELEEKILYLKNNSSERIKLANNFTKLCEKRRKKINEFINNFFEKWKKP